MRSGTAAILEVLVMEGQPPRRTSIFFMPTIASKRTLCFAAGRQRLGQHALSWPPLPTMAFQ
jgi:hypothetical protein